jgi:hypothetical protein
MRYRKLTGSELVALGEAIRKASVRQTIDQLARRTGYSKGFVAKARYLVRCKPDLWASCCAGLITVNTGYNVR